MISSMHLPKSFNGTSTPANFMASFVASFDALTIESRDSSQCNENAESIKNPLQCTPKSTFMISFYFTI